ncbi:MAG TPA: NAD(P)-binding domain-containing protein [Casimicrobiaceae bacterium]|nr:NAD(P)-binding domain-containing protein [Casimicrobiaceae bacterium]
MEIGLVGLRDERVARRFAAAGVRVFACDAEGRADALAAASILVAKPGAAAVAQALHAPRVVWLDLPTGFATELAIQDVWPEFSPGDVIVDAGRGTPSDGARRAAQLASARILFVDGRVRAEDGRLRLYLGGGEAAVRALAPYADVLAGPSGWMHCGAAGSGYHWELDEEALR